MPLYANPCKLAKNNSGAIGREFESLRARQSSSSFTWGFFGAGVKIPKFSLCPELCPPSPETKKAVTRHRNPQFNYSGREILALVQSGGLSPRPMVRRAPRSADAGPYLSRLYALIGSVVRVASSIMHVVTYCFVALPRARSGRRELNKQIERAVTLV